MHPTRTRPFTRALALLLISALSSACAARAPHAPAAEAHAAPSRHGGHPHHHSFEGAEAWAERFDDPARDAWQKPDAVLQRLALRRGMTVADIGSGTGYFAVRLARALPRGRVYGIDIEPDMVRYLNERAAREGLANLESRLGEPHDPKLPPGVELVLVVDTYHHMQDRAAYFRRLAGQLAPGARVAIVDFKPGELPVGPPEAIKVPPDEIIDEMGAAGYELANDDRSLLPYQVLQIYEAPN